MLTITTTFSRIVLLPCDQLIIASNDSFAHAHFYPAYIQSRAQSPRSSRSRNKGLWHNPFVFPTNRGDPVLLRMCKVFQDGGHANRNTSEKYTLFYFWAENMKNFLLFSCLFYIMRFIL